MEDEKKARLCLNDATWKLRRDLKRAGAIEECLSTTRDSVAFNFDCNHDYDVARFEGLVDVVAKATDMETLQQVIQLYRGRFLESFDISDVSDEFRSWAEGHEDVIENQYHKFLHMLCLHKMLNGDYNEAIESLNILRTAAPAEQAVYGLLMICYAVMGHVDQAEKVYQHYVTTMAATLDLPPHTTLERLRRVIQDRQFSALQARKLIDSALQENRQAMDQQLQAALTMLGESIGARKILLPNDAYRRVLHQAQVEAEHHGGGLVGTSHLFLALRIDADATMDYIRELLPEDLERDIDAVLGENRHDGNHTSIYTLELHNVLQHAHEVAKDYEADGIDLPHLWLALLREENTLVGQLLERYGICRESLIHEMESVEGGH